LLKRTGIALGTMLVIAPLLFLLSAWVGSSIPRNSDWQVSTDGVEIMIGSNGIHTEIAMPITNDVMDWSSVFSTSDLRDPDRPYTHIAISWGERAFFLETPTWADVKPGVVASALTGGDAILHAAWYVRPAPSADFRPLTISREEYAELSKGIEAQLAPQEERKTYQGYGSYDAFYDATGTYHLGNTCNQWTSDQLAAAGIKTGSWSPMPGGVMKWVPELD